MYTYIYIYIYIYIHIETPWQLCADPPSCQSIASIDLLII